MDKPLKEMHVIGMDGRAVQLIQLTLALTEVILKAHPRNDHADYNSIREIYKLRAQVRAQIGG